MTVRRRWIGALVALAGTATGAGAVGGAFAQGGGDAAIEDEEGAGVAAQALADLTPEQQVEEGAAIVRRGTALSRRVSTMLDEARREQDIIRVTCVNDKLTQVNANLRTSEQRFENLESAVEAGDRSRANHEYTVLVVLGQKFVVLDRESTQCLGQDVFETGATRVELTIDPATPGEDPTIIAPIGTPVIPFIPPPDSPTI